MGKCVIEYLTSFFIEWYGATGGWAAGKEGEGGTGQKGWEQCLVINWILLPCKPVSLSVHHTQSMWQNTWARARWLLWCTHARHTNQTPFRYTPQPLAGGLLKISPNFLSSAENFIILVITHENTWRKSNWATIRSHWFQYKLNYATITNISKINCRKNITNMFKLSGSKIN